MTAAQVLAQHVDGETTRHRLTLLDPQHLRCHDCARTLVLPSGAGSTSTSSELRNPPRPHDPTACREHVGEWASSCRSCRADRIADEARERKVVPLSDVARLHLQDARRQLAGRTTTTKETTDA